MQKAHDPNGDIHLEENANRAGGQAACLPSVKTVLANGVTPERK